MRLRRTQAERKKRIVAARLSAFRQVDGLFFIFGAKKFFGAGLRQTRFFVPLKAVKTLDDSANVQIRVHCL